MDLTARAALDRTLLLTRQQRLPDASNDDILAGLTGTSISIVSDEPNLLSPAGQAMVSTLAGLVFGMGMQVRLIVPEVTVVGFQPPLQGDKFRAAIIELGADSVPGVRVEIAESPGIDDLVFVIGDSRWKDERGRLAWRLSAVPWSGSLVPAREPGERIQSKFPMGALAVAAAAASEPYKAALRSIASRTGCTVPEPLYLEPAVRVLLKLAPSGTPCPDRLDLGAVDVVSGGAITTAAFHALLRIPAIAGVFRVWEPELLDISNLNRYPLMRRSLIGRPKLEMLDYWLRGRPSFTGVRRALNEHTLDDMGPWASRVLVGTDNADARLLVQRTWPEWLGVAGTAGFMAMVSEHEPGQACAGCLHSWTENVPGNVPTVSFVSYWGGLLAATRLLRRQLSGSVAPTEQLTTVWADRLDSPTAVMPGPVSRLEGCAVGCI